MLLFPNKSVNYCSDIGVFRYWYPQEVSIIMQVVGIVLKCVTFISITCIS